MTKTTCCSTCIKYTVMIIVIGFMASYLAEHRKIETIQRYTTMNDISIQVHDHPDTILNLPKTDRGLWKLAVYRAKHLFFKVPNEFMDNQMCEIYVRNNYGIIIPDLPNTCLRENIYREAVENNLGNVQYTPTEYINRDTIYRIFATGRTEFLQYIPDKNLVAQIKEQYEEDVRRRQLDNEDDDDDDDWFWDDDDDDF